jgi:transcription initiation factor TFIIB
VSDPVDWESQIAVKDKSESNLVDALSRTEAVAGELLLSKDQVIRSGELIAKAWQTNFMHGRSQERTIGAVVYAVSREADWALPPAMIAEVVEADKGAIKQTFQKLNRDLDLDIDPPVPSEFVTAIISKLEIPAKIEPVTKHKLRQYDASGSNPIGIAAAGVYITCIQTGVNITLVDLAQVVGLTKETIWRQKKTLLEE